MHKIDICHGEDTDQLAHRHALVPFVTFLSAYGAAMMWPNLGQATSSEGTPHVLQPCSVVM